MHLADHIGWIYSKTYRPASDLGQAEFRHSFNFAVCAYRISLYVITFLRSLHNRAARNGSWKRNFPTAFSRTNRLGCVALESGRIEVERLNQRGIPALFGLISWELRHNRSHDSSGFVFSRFRIEYIHLDGSFWKYFNLGPTRNSGGLGSFPAITGRGLEFCRVNRNTVTIHDGLAAGIPDESSLNR